jgi:hypothetical protein
MLREGLSSRKPAVAACAGRWVSAGTAGAAWVIGYDPAATWRSL